MADFYTKMAAVATRLIQAKGATVVVNKLNAAPADPDKPWRGAADPRAPYAATVTCKAVHLGTQGSLGDLGKLIKKEDIPDEVETLHMLEPGSTDLSDFDEMVTEGRTESIKFVLAVKPADVVLLWVLGTCK